MKIKTAPQSKASNRRGLLIDRGPLGLDVGNIMMRAQPPPCFEAMGSWGMFLFAVCWVYAVLKLTVVGIEAELKQKKSREAREMLATAQG